MWYAWIQNQERQVILVVAYVVLIEPAMHGTEIDAFKKNDFHVR